MPAKHKVDEYRRAIDPQMRQLEDELAILAGIFRNSSLNKEERDATIHKYTASLDRLYDLGWDGPLDVMSELPDEYMPERYTKLYPDTNKSFNFPYKNPKVLEAIAKARQKKKNEE